MYGTLGLSLSAIANVDLGRDGNLFEAARSGGSFSAIVDGKLGR